MFTLVRDSYRISWCTGPPVAFDPYRRDVSGASCRGPGAVRRVLASIPTFRRGRRVGRFVPRADPPEAVASPLVHVPRYEPRLRRGKRTPRGRPVDCHTCHVFGRRWRRVDWSTVCASSVRLLHYLKWRFFFSARARMGAHGEFSAVLCNNGSEDFFFPVVIGVWNVYCFARSVRWMGVSTFFRFLRCSGGFLFFYLGESPGSFFRHGEFCLYRAFLYECLAFTRTFRTKLVFVHFSTRKSLLRTTFHVGKLFLNEKLAFEPKEINL